jgi:D-inositol-3-phosphate glycosyltransferase
MDMPLVSTFHTLARVKAEASPEEISTDEPHRRAEAEAEIVSCSDAVLVSCYVEAEQLVALYGADPARVEIVPPGVDHAFFAPGDRTQARRALGFAPGEPLVLFVGRIQPLKGADVAIRAVGLLRSSDGLADVNLAVVGGPSGPCGRTHDEEIGRLVAFLGLQDRVRRLPAQSHELLSTFYRAADVCVMPSRSESFGLVALEAAACGIPVVASAVGGLTTLVQDGVSGVLVEERAPEAYARAIAKLLAEPLLGAEMGAAGADLSRGYTWAGAARKLLGVYDGLVEVRLVSC